MLEVGILRFRFFYICFLWIENFNEMAIVRKILWFFPANYFRTSCMNQTHLPVCSIINLGNLAETCRDWVGSHWFWYRFHISWSNSILRQGFTCPWKCKAFYNLNLLDSVPRKRPWFSTLFCNSVIRYFAWPG